jgi:hypothetical protein
MTTIIPAWIREHNKDGVWAILGSEPPADATDEFIEAGRLESVVASDHEANGRKFGVIVMKGEWNETDK